MKRSEQRRVVSGKPEAEATEAEGWGLTEGQWPVDSDQSDATQEADMEAEREMEWTDGPDPFVSVIDEDATNEEWERFNLIRGLMREMQIAARSLAHMPTNWNSNPDDYRAAAAQVLSATLRVIDELETAQIEAGPPEEWDRGLSDYDLYRQKCDHWEEWTAKFHLRYLAALLCPHTTREHVVIALIDWGEAYWEYEQLQYYWD